MKKFRPLLLVPLLAVAACTGNFYPPGDTRVIGSVPPICTFFGKHSFDESMDPSCKAPRGRQARRRSVGQGGLAAMWNRFVKVIGRALASMERSMALAVRKRFGGAGPCAWCGESRPDCDVCRK